MSNFKKCPVCKTVLQHDFKFCTECGEKISKTLEIKNKIEGKKQKEITKTIKCPSCGETTQIQGSTGDRVTVICPKCKTKGFFQFC
ncbi:MAG: zinc ribbon domain-containing protein [Thermoplasmatales archaeon]|nr:MAG: zinc ribbon domain-containing protein [Thermoplasmatales archaeon]